jgi:hypothetical protein
MLYRRFSPAPMTAVSAGKSSNQELASGPNSIISAHKVNLQSTMSASLAPKSGMLPSQLHRHHDDEVDTATDSDPDFRTSTPASYNDLPEDIRPPFIMPQVTRISINNPTAFDDSVIEVAQTSITSIPTTSVASAGPKTSGKWIRQYVLPDGSVAANGKGLGRGRPGIKRGPRPSKTSAEGSVEMDTTPGPSSQPPTEQLSTPVNNKRKRADSDVANTRRQSSSSLLSQESTPEYNPTASQTRSGRPTQKPVPIVISTSATASPATKRQNSSQTISTPVLKSHPKIKRRVYRGKEQSALCEHCTRGFGPIGNVIVFCDACNKCWHQRCHTPQISMEVVADSNADWFCNTCDKILHGKKAKKLSLPAKSEVVVEALPPPPPPIQKYGLPLISAQMLSLEQRQNYLSTLSKEKLIDIVVLAGNLAPNMPIFETPLPLPPPPSQRPQPQFASNYVTPVTELPEYERVGANEIQDEGYDDHFDEHAALYPTPGEGVQLPPDREDLHMLLEGPESKTFSHWVRGMPMKSMVDSISLV